MTVCVLIYLVPNIRRIAATSCLLFVPPISCSVEDFIITSYVMGEKKHYHIYLLLKDKKTQKLFFTYGKYSLSVYNYAYGKYGSALTNINIFRKDGSLVAVGDEVSVYIKKRVNVNVDFQNEQVRFNKKPFVFKNVNEQYAPTIFANVVFYEGLVDVEPLT